MIHTIKIQNYQSLRDETRVDFTVGKQAPRNPRYITTSMPETRATLIQSLMGPNGSGKTTVLKAIALVRWLIVKSFREDERKLPVHQFAGLEDQGEPTTLEVTFEMNKQVHVYKVSLNSAKILSEELYIRSLTSTRVTKKRLFEREWDHTSSKYIVNDSLFGISEEFWESEELSNSTIIAAARRFGNVYATNIVKYWELVKTNVEIEDRYRPYQIEAYLALRYYEQHPESRKAAEADIKKYDLGIDGFGKNGTIKHRYGKKSFELEIDQESSGTQQLLVLHKMIKDVLEKGGIAIIDELNAYLHPLMSEAIIGKFLNPKVNKGNGQLIFSTHDIHSFDLLEKYEISLVEKSNGVTKLSRLDTFPGVRNTDNLEKKYLEGTYGAIPKINN